MPGSTKKVFSTPSTLIGFCSVAPSFKDSKGGRLSTISTNGEILVETSLPSGVRIFRVGRSETDKVSCVT